MILSATGHRPDKLGGYADSVLARLERGATRYLQLQAPVTKVISGMALGWDQAWAVAAHKLGIPFIAAIPFAGQEGKWPEESQSRYRALLRHAAEVVVVCEGGYQPAKMQVRNMWIVDRCDKLVALWDGTPGGTANCVRYAEEMRRPIDNLWAHFAKFSRG